LHSCRPFFSRSLPTALCCRKRSALAVSVPLPSQACVAYAEGPVRSSAANIRLAGVCEGFCAALQVKKESHAIVHVGYRRRG